MNRAYALLLIVVAVLFWLGWRARKENPLLATGLFTAAAVTAVLLVLGFFGVIGA